MEKSNLSLHGSFSTQVNNYLLIVITKFARATKNTISKDLGNTWEKLPPNSTSLTTLFKT